MLSEETTEGPVWGSRFECDCGRQHHIPIEKVVVQPDCVSALPDLLRSQAAGKNIGVLMDRRTVGVLGDAVCNQLSSAAWCVQPYILSDGVSGSPVCDDHQLLQLQSSPLAHADYLVAVGSGVINDLAKWLAAESQIPYLVCATAASMNGYASANVAPVVDGVKQMRPGRAPLSILADPNVLCAAPLSLTTAGLGDILAKSVSLLDWQVNHLLFGDYFCALGNTWIQAVEPAYVDNPQGLRTGNPASILGLFHALLYSGLAMTLAGTSFPASGGEHLISHTLDMLALRDGTGHDLHGRQVGLGTIFAAGLYERLLKLEDPVFHATPDDTDSAYWGSLTPMVERENALKRTRVLEAQDRLRSAGVWDSIRGMIEASGISASALRECLRAAGGATRVEDIGAAPKSFTACVLHCHQMRSRFTIIDLARLVGLLPGEIEELVAEVT